METDKQALLNYLLGGGVQQEKPASPVIRQGQTNYTQGHSKAIPVPTREELEAQRRIEAEKKAAATAALQAFVPMNWSQLESCAQPMPEIKTAAQPQEIKAPPWERLRTK